MTTSDVEEREALLARIIEERPKIDHEDNRWPADASYRLVVSHDIFLSARELFVDSELNGLSYREGKASGFNKMRSDRFSFDSMIIEGLRNCREILRPIVSSVSRRFVNYFRCN